MYLQLQLVRATAQVQLIHCIDMFQLEGDGDELEVCDDFAVFDDLVDTEDPDGKEVAPYQPTTDFKLGKLASITLLQLWRLLLR